MAVRQFNVCALPIFIHSRGLDTLSKVGEAEFDAGDRAFRLLGVGLGPAARLVAHARVRGVQRERRAVGPRGASPARSNQREGRQRHERQHNSVRGGHYLRNASLRLLTFVVTLLSAFAAPWAPRHQADLPSSCLSISVCPAGRAGGRAGGGGAVAGNRRAVGASPAAGRGELGHAGLCSAPLFRSAITFAARRALAAGIRR